MALSAAGTLTGVSSGDGRVMWSRLLFPRSSGIDCGAVHTRCELVATLADPPEVTVFVSGPQRGALFWVDVMSGEVRRRAGLQAEGGAARSMFLLPSDVRDRDGRRPVVVLSRGDGAARAMVFPSSAEVADGMRRLLASEAGGRIILRHVDPLSGALSGYELRLREEGGRASASGVPVSVEEVWSLSFRGDDDFPSDSSLGTAVGNDTRSEGVIVKVAAPLPDEAVFSTARILGDDSLLMKYVSSRFLIHECFQTCCPYP